MDASCRSPRARLSSTFEEPPHSKLSGLPNANAKTPRFSYAISQIATLPPVVALNRSSKSQIAARYAAFWHEFPKSHWPLSFSAPKSQRFKSQRLQDANSTKSQTLAFYESQRFSATKILRGKLGFMVCFPSVANISNNINNDKHLQGPLLRTWSLRMHATTACHSQEQQPTPSA